MNFAILSFEEGNCIMRNPMASFGFPFICYLLLSSMLWTCTTLGIMNPGQSIRDDETLVSSGGSFELGFFRPGNSKSWYLGIWYKKTSTEAQTVVWVANSETPLSDNRGSLNFTTQGILVLYNSTNDVIWLTNTNTSTAPLNPVAELLESGNLVVKKPSDSNPENFLWQSFDYPCDNLLPGMKLGMNFETGHESFLSSWKSRDDPSRGEFSVHIDTRGYPQLIHRKGSVITFRVGSWNGLWFNGVPSPPDSTFAPEFVINEKEVYFKMDIQNRSVVSRYVLNPSGTVQRFTRMDQTQGWVAAAASQIDKCQNYGFCGGYSTCDRTGWPGCSCLDGFIPKTQNGKVNLTDGCRRRQTLACSEDDWFLKRRGIKLPDTSSSWFDRSLSLSECEQLCLKNCACTAYANLDIRGSGSGCLQWYGDLIDIREFAENTQDLYIRMSASEPVQIEKKGSSDIKHKKVVIAISSVISITGILILGITFYTRKRKYRKRGIVKNGQRWDYNNESKMQDTELLIFDLATIMDATNKFSIDNKLGKGGFGPVYKGMLERGQEIAVKRLSKNSGQGVHEFKNEVILVTKLQHRNLVKLLGYCIHEDEYILIYEYMPNKSLDSFIFDQVKSKLLDWKKRLHIIDGIARGILYLHQDSRSRIIHRDLKASNVLLDKDMIPKISDFGLARIFGVDQIEANTKRVAGTYGYMSPEYAVDGLFSMKSDVFSFGVLVLEIISGKKNRGFHHPNHDHNLLGHAWMLWNEERSLELLAKGLSDLNSLSDQLLRCIHVALLCVQLQPRDRPSMSSVVVMLSSDGSLPQPKQPGFFIQRNAPETNTSPSKHESYSTNKVTITLLDAR